MNIEKLVQTRSEGKCELCASDKDLSIFKVESSGSPSIDNSVHICSVCLEQVEDPEKVIPNHWRCLNDSMWSPVPAVQVLAWRMLNRLRSEGWPIDLLDMLYLDEETLAWAKSSGDGMSEEENIKHLDSNGVVLSTGDSVVLIKNLDVKGANFTAKQGTAVRNISLVADNPEQIEGRVNDQKIVILTKFVKKSS